MSLKNKIILSVLSFLITIGLVAFTVNKNSTDDIILSYTVNTQKQDLQFYWKNDKAVIINSIQNLKTYIKNKNSILLFAVNGGMFNRDFSPQGLFIQNKKVISPLDTSEGKGNFYLKPNGIFYITTTNNPVVCKTTDFINDGTIKYATQSGPMLGINGQIHSAFKEGFANLNIRNGADVLPNNDLVFAMPKKEINFYDFAKYFQGLGCKNALYLDGFI